MTIGTRIQKLRTQKGYTQEYLANQLGISRQAVHKWEKNETRPDTDNLILLAEILGTTVEYILNYILEGNGLKVGEDVKVEYLSEHSELVAKMTKGEVEYGVLPQPFVTVATAQNPDLKISLSLTDEWNKISPDTKLSMGCVIARTEFIEENPEAVKNFIAENKASVEFVNTNVDAAAELVVQYGIIGKAAIAKKAIPECNIVFIDGEEMKTIAAANYQVYFNADPTSIGGAVPSDDIYYVAE